MLSKRDVFSPLSGWSLLVHLDRWVGGCSPSCPYGISKTPVEFLSTESKMNSFGSVKLRFIFPGLGRFYPSPGGFPRPILFGQGVPRPIRRYPRLIRGSWGQQSWEISFPLITRHPWPRSGHPFPSNNSGRMSRCGKYFPLASSPFGYPPRGPSNNISSICFI
jgi:hypothetical protein